MPREPLSSGQIERFERLAWPHLPALLRVAGYMTADNGRAEDLVQETMLKALRFIDSYRDGTDVKAWLMTIMRRTHIDNLRADRKRANEVYLDDLVSEPADSRDDPEPEPDMAPSWRQPDVLLNRFEDDALIEALKKLPEDIRWTLLLVDVEGLDHLAAAEVLGVPEGTIKSRAFRGRRMLREHLSEVAQKRGWLAAGKDSPR